MQTSDAINTQDSSVNSHKIQYGSSQGGPAHMMGSGSKVMTNIQSNGPFTTHQNSFMQSTQMGLAQRQRPLPQGFTSLNNDALSANEVRQGASVYSNAKTSFYSNMQQSAAAQQQQILMSPTTNDS